MIALTVDTFESIMAQFTLFGFELRRVDFEVWLTTPSEMAMVFDLVWTTTLDTLRSLETAYKCHIIPFPAILALGNA